MVSELVFRLTRDTWPNERSEIWTSNMSDPRRTRRSDGSIVFDALTLLKAPGAASQPRYCTPSASKYSLPNVTGHTPWEVREQGLRVI